MVYSKTYKTQWHDTDASRTVRTSRLLTYMQETANLQCEEYGLPLDALRDERGLGFILGQLCMRILSPIRAHKEITVNTWCRETKGYAFYRYFDVIQDGKTVAVATTVWALVDISTKTLVKSEVLGTQSFPYDLPIPVHLLPPKAIVGKNEALDTVGKRTVRYSDIDYNMHMNNTHYPDMLCDFLPDMAGRFVSEISLSYLKEAPLGATLDVRLAAREDGSYIMQTKNESFETCLEARIKLAEI